MKKLMILVLSLVLTWSLIGCTSKIQSSDAVIVSVQLQYTDVNTFKVTTIVQGEKTVLEVLVGTDISSFAVIPVLGNKTKLQAIAVTAEMFKGFDTTVSGEFAVRLTYKDSSTSSGTRLHYVDFTLKVI